MENVRVRFAPSPTGYLHIGGARTALFNWFFARKYQGQFVLRIEDTDQQRLKEDSVSQILTSLKWLGITWDEGPEAGGPYGPYSQSERLEFYRAEADRLVREGKAYYCFCPAEELAAERERQREAGQSMRYEGKCRSIASGEAEARIQAGEEAVIRLRVPDSGKISVKDLIHKEVSFDAAQLDDLIIVKSNGIPAYNFACVVDDHAMRISHVIRAEEHLSNTPKQVLLYQALGYQVPEFAHLPMILAPDRSKLSKRHGATSVEEFRAQGFIAPAIVNYLTFLGWSSGSETEIITPSETVELFELANVSKKASIYDTKKLAWMNGQYLGSMSPAAVVRAAMPFLIESGLIGAELSAQQAAYIENVVAAVRTRVKTLAELPEAAAYFFKEVTEYEEKGLRKYFAVQATAGLLRQAKRSLEELDCFDVLHTEEAYRQLTERLAVKSGDLIHPTRLALTGRLASPGLFEVMELLGKQRSLERLEQAIRFIEDSR